MLKNPVVSVPSSGRPSCDTTLVTSGKDRNTRAHLVGQLGAMFERDGQRHRRVRPDVSLLQLGQKLAAQQREQRQRRDHQNHDQRSSVRRGHAQHAHEKPVVEGAIAPRSDCEPLSSRGRRNTTTAPAKRNREQDRDAEREGVGMRHRRKDRALDTAHREQRQKRDHENDASRRTSGRQLPAPRAGSCSRVAFAAAAHPRSDAARCSPSR